MPNKSAQFMNDNLTSTQIQDDIKVAERELSDSSARAFKLWERIKVPASLWNQEQYSMEPTFWVIAIMGGRCLYFNYVEGGWGWGQYQDWGKIDTYHWQQDEISHVVFQLLFAIDNEDGQQATPPRAAVL